MPPKYNVKKAFMGKQNRTFAKKQLVPFLKKAGKAGIRSLASAYGGPEGASLANQIIGKGRYDLMPSQRHYTAGAHMHGPQIRRAHHGYQTPHMGNGGNDHKSLITHSEYIGDLVSNGTTNSFIAQNYAINAGNNGTFAWLSATAIQYQNYKFKKLVFEYRPLVSNSTASSNGALVSMGKVVLAIQYDSVLGAYTSSQQAENSEGSVSIKPSEPALIGIECNSALNPLGVYYVSGQNSLTVGANGSDIRMQNMGIFSAIANGIPTTSSTPIDLGELWVHYTVELLKPQLNAGLSNVLSSHYQITGLSNTYSLGTSQVAIGNNYLPLTFITPTTCNSFTLPLSVTEGSFLLTWVCNGTSALACDAPTCSITNGVLINAFFGSTTANAQVPSVGAPEPATRTSNTIIFSVNAPGSALCQITFATGINPTGASCDLILTPYNTTMA